MLCILTSKWVLRMLFAGQNHLFHHLNKFFHLFRHRRDKRRKSTKYKEKYELLLPGAEEGFEPGT